MLNVLDVAMGNGFKSHNKLWEPSRLFDKSTNEKYAVIILNQPILISPNIMLPIWQKGSELLSIYNSII